MQITPFESQSTDALVIGADALLYVMAHGHTISVPTQALRLAEKVAVISIARRDTPQPVLRDVNRAIDLIAASIRTRERLDLAPAALTTPPAAPMTAPDSGLDGGYRVPLQPAPRSRPPASVARPIVDVAF